MHACVLEREVGAIDSKQSGKRRALAQMHTCAMTETDSEAYQSFSGFMSISSSTACSQGDTMAGQQP